MLLSFFFLTDFKSLWTEKMNPFFICGFSGFSTPPHPSTGPPWFSVWRESAANRTLREAQNKLEQSVFRSGWEFGVAWRGKLALQVFDDVERKTADQRDGRDFPQERPGGDERQIWERRWSNEEKRAQDNHQRKCFSRIQMLLLMQRRVSISTMKQMNWCIKIKTHTHTHTCTNIMRTTEKGDKGSRGNTSHDYWGMDEWMSGGIHRLHTYPGKLHRTPCLSLVSTHKSKTSAAGRQKLQTHTNRQPKHRAENSTTSKTAPLQNQRDSNHSNDA